jgi:hypothetical protein
MEVWEALIDDIADNLTIHTVLDPASRTMQAGNSCGLNAIAYAVSHVDPVITQNTAGWEPSSNPFRTHAIELRSVINDLPKHEGGRATPDTDAAGLLVASRLALTGLAIVGHALNPTTIDGIKSSIVASESAASACSGGLAPAAESAPVASAAPADASGAEPSASAENAPAVSVTSADAGAPLLGECALSSATSSVSSAGASALAPALERATSGGGMLSALAAAVASVLASPARSIEALLGSSPRAASPSEGGGEGGRSALPLSSGGTTRQASLGPAAPADAALPLPSSAVSAVAARRASIVARLTLATPPPARQPGRNPNSFALLSRRDPGDASVMGAQQRGHAVAARAVAGTVSVGARTLKLPPQARPLRK